MKSVNEKEFEKKEILENKAKQELNISLSCYENEISNN